MSNYNINQKNDLIARSDGILDYLTGMYMDQYRDGILAQSGDFYRLGALSFNHILSYRKVEGDDATRSRIASAFRKWLGLLFTEDCALGYFIHSDRTSVHLSLAAEAKSNISLGRVLGASIPELRTQETQGLDLEWRGNSEWGGVLVNIPPMNAAFIDHVLDNLSGIRGTIGMLAFPSLRSEEYMAGLMSLKTQIDSLNDFSNSYGSGSRRTIKSSFPSLGKLAKYLDGQIERWSGTHGMWEACIWFSAESETEADQLGAMLAGAIGAQENMLDSPCMYFLTDRNPFQSGSFEIPGSEYDHRNLGLPHGLLKSPLETFLTFDDLATLLQLPLYSHPGFEVFTTEGTSSPMRPFDIGSSLSGELTIGTVSDTDSPFQLRLADLTEHALVTGATGSGKTNTVMRIVEGLQQYGIPYCILEPSKKDYWILSSRDDALQVFSVGQDALPLKLNPFIPEQGIDIAAHIGALMYAFSGAFEMEAPTRFALEGLLKYTYTAYGWDLSDIYYGQQRELPQIQDLIAQLPTYMERELQYGTEVSDNIKGAILNRLKSMNEGIIARITSCSSDESLSGQYLCTHNIVVELDDLPVDLKSFVAELVLMKVSQYLRRQNPAPGLRNVIVLEEAHNIFPEVPAQQAQSSRAIASEYFSNMLSEIREYGTGLVIADQGASRINSNAIANTKVKILHAVSSRADAEAEAYAMHLDARRMSYLPEFPVGEALIAVRGRPQVWRVAVAGVSRVPPRNFACLFCRHRQMCVFDEIAHSIPPTDMAIDSAATVAVKNAYDMNNWNSLIAWVQRQYHLSTYSETCLLGYLLEHYADTCGAREKRRILYLYDSWRTANANS